METSTLIARLFAPLYLSIGLGMFLSPKYYKKMLGELTHATTLAYLGGTIALVIGVLIVTYHNAWEGNWTLIITLMGWLTLLKGVLLLMIPEPFIELISPLIKSRALPVVGAVALGLGLILGYFGFLA